MKYAGIDLHKRDLVVGVEDEGGPVGKARRLPCRDEKAIREYFEGLRPFCAVIETPPLSQVSTTFKKAPKAERKTKGRGQKTMLE